MSFAPFCVFHPRLISAARSRSSNCATACACSGYRGSLATYLRLWVEPLMGKKPLDRITDEDVQRLKAKMQHLSPKTANNALTVLAKMLRVAVE